MTFSTNWKVGLCVSVLALAPGSAQAQWPFSDGWSNSDSYQQRPRQRPKVRPATAAKTQRLKPVEPAYRKPEGPLFAVVSISDQRITVHDANGPITRSPVSTGKTGHRTPTGIFSVIQKNRWHRSNIYSGAPMPYMQRITWSGIALHEGMLPGYPASHGCIRMPRSFAAQMWGMTRLGVRVIVAPHDIAISAFSSQALPTPVFATGSVADLGGSTRITRVAAAEPAAADGMSDAPAVGTTRELNPAENAVAERTRIRHAAAEAVKAAKAAHEASLKASADAREAAAELKRAEARLASAREDQRAEAEVAVTDARARESVRSSAAYAAARAAREAEDTSEATAKSLKAAERAVEPMHVFISRKERKLYVRQGFTPMFDAPVTFKNPDLALGTHLFTAIGTDETGKALRWNAVTMPERSGPAEREPVRRGQRPAAAAVEAPVASAAAALQNVEIPEETMRRLGERVWVGASLIITDHPTSSETGLGTDFIVLTK